MNGELVISMEPLALTVPEAAPVLRISERTLRRRIAEGKIPVYFEGADQRIAVESLRAYVAKQADILARGRRPRLRAAK